MARQPGDFNSSLMCEDLGSVPASRDGGFFIPHPGRASRSLGDLMTTLEDRLFWQFRVLPLFLLCVCGGGMCVRRERLNMYVSVGRKVGAKVGREYVCSSFSH